MCAGDGDWLAADDVVVVFEARRGRMASKSIPGEQNA
jgi:hypothetical protein